jgi:DNA-directed RNA polymerase subunit RPC12/RpoP
MYPTIQRVECPRCGSPRKQQLGADLYRCDDCGMNYSLDWVKGGVRVRWSTAPLPTPMSRWVWLPFKVLLLVVVAILILAGLSFLVAPTGRR